MNIQKFLKVSFPIFLLICLCPILGVTTVAMENKKEDVLEDLVASLSFPLRAMQVGSHSIRTNSAIVNEDENSFTYISERGGGRNENQERLRKI